MRAADLLVALPRRLVQQTVVLGHNPCVEKSVPGCALVLDKNHRRSGPAARGRGVGVRARRQELADYQENTTRLAITMTE